MKQIILPFHTGKPELMDVPAPTVQPGELLIRTTASVVSTGTERMLMDFGKAGWLGKLRQQPEKARQVLTKLKTDGVSPTIKAVRNKLDAPIPLGYSQAGVVLAVGAGIYDIKAGDRVASNGAHAEVVSVPRNLVAKIPDNVPDDVAAFTVLGAIALQGIRLAEPTFGETIVVFGLGLIGQLTTQLLLANGCRVIGAELNESRLALATAKGAIPLTLANGDAVRAQTNGFGADAVIVTASASNDSILNIAADMCRKRGRVVLTGVVDMNLSREMFFRKELSFQVSASYGPGRYERAYEQGGLDYPIGYVRWTEGRNFDAVLGAMARGQIDLTPLISERLPFIDALSAYDRLGDARHLATVFTYSGTPPQDTIVSRVEAAHTSSGTGIALIGAGAFVGSMLLPALQKARASVQAIVSKNGLSAATLARKYDIPEAGTDAETVFKDVRCGAVVIATPHHTHAALTANALRAGKSVFVEKPLALNRAELNEVTAALQESPTSVTIGFNRRYASLAIITKQMLEGLGGPMNIIVNINAGALPAGHWLNDKSVGGGRLPGEACHFIDLCRYFTGSAITAVCANSLVGNENSPSEDASILLRFADGSNAVVNYFSNGNKAYDKERLEVYRAGCTIIIENWRSLRSYGFKKDVHKRLAQDKGHAALIAAWLQHLKGGPAPMRLDEILNSTEATLAIEESIAANAWISL